MSTELKAPEKEAAVEALPKPEPVRIRPSTDIYRDEHAVRILLDVPGASDEAVEVSVHDGSLLVKARVERDEADLRLYECSFRIDRRMDTQKIEANLQRGVLRIRIPFHEEVLPKRIPVLSGD